MNRLFKTLPLILVFGITACSASNDESNAEVAEVKSAPTEPVKATEISWEQLMPKGEEETLEKLYSDYYEERERQFLEDQAKVNSDQAETNADMDTQDLVSIIAEGSADDTMEQIGTFNVVEELNGVKIRLPGFVVPFDFNADANYQEFLLVPYFGACLHTPPPPPNQIVFVKAEPAANIQNINEPVWVEGVLKTGKFDSDLANTAYELVLDKVEAYAY